MTNKIFLWAFIALILSPLAGTLLLAVWLSTAPDDWQALPDYMEDDTHA